MMFASPLCHCRPRWQLRVCHVPLTQCSFWKTHSWFSRDMTIFRTSTGTSTQKLCTLPITNTWGRTFTFFYFMALVMVVVGNHVIHLTSPWGDLTISTNCKYLNISHIYHHDIFWCQHHRYKFVAEIEDIYMDPSCPSRRSFNSDFDSEDMVVRFASITFTPSNVRLFN